MSLRQIGFERLEGYPGGGFWGAGRLVAPGQVELWGWMSSPKMEKGEKGIEDGVLNRRLRGQGRALWQGGGGKGRRWGRSIHRIWKLVSGKGSGRASPWYGRGSGLPEWVWWLLIGSHSVLQRF